ncbi:MAG: RNA 2',3'-cyclic phosphodiesterase [Vicinamibacteria bacterium]|nr:RNA 2',3'-cyclic phosphodiesterase [Vicinamibacteria bacterium]
MMIGVDDSEKTIRSFVALAIDEPMRSRIIGVVRDLRGRIRDVRWASDAQIHVTLRFLGQASLAALEKLKVSLAVAAAGCPPEEALFSELGVFPARGNPRVLWLGMTLTPALFALQKACADAAVAAGFPPDTRPFRPHLTLGRWRSLARRPTLPDVDLGRAPFSRVILYQSELRPAGAIYTPLQVCMLGSAGE